MNPPFVLVVEDDPSVRGLLQTLLTAEGQQPRAKAAIEITKNALKRIRVAMAREGLFFGWVGEVEPRTGVPRRALLIQGAITCVYLLFTLGGSR